MNLTKKNNKGSNAIPQKIKDELDKMLVDFSDAAFNEIILKPSSPELQEHYAKNKNSYAYWGPETAQLVKTPDSFYVPISLDAYKTSCFVKDCNPDQLNQNNLSELFYAAKLISKWSTDKNLDEIFLKNSTFSGKHRWAFTCNVDFKINPNENRYFTIFNHMVNINDWSALVRSGYALGFLARKKLDLEPQFYAFGSKFYKITNTATGDYQIAETGANAQKSNAIKNAVDSDPELQLETIHIGMPITKEVRIFTINGRVNSFIPYWTPVAFENQEIYGIKNNMPFEYALEQTNTIHPSDMEHLKTETNKIISHPKFNDTNWAIDWVITRDGQWYMIDMQVAENSYMDYKNAKWAHDAAQSEAINLINKELELLKRIKKETTVRDRILAAFLGVDMNIDKKLQRCGYPTQKELININKRLNNGKIK